MKKLSYLFAALLMLVLAGCGSKRSQAFYNMPSQLLSTTYDGRYIIRVQVRSKDAVVAFEDGKRKAIQEVIFDGVKAANSGIEDLKPLIYDINAREKYEDYFRAFFSDKKEWDQFADYFGRRVVTTRYERDGRQMVEIVTVQVDRAGIKQKLQNDGIIPREGRY